MLKTNVERLLFAYLVAKIFVEKKKLDTTHIAY
jgi:hypothetical protein